MRPFPAATFGLVAMISNFGFTLASPVATATSSSAPDPTPAFSWSPSSGGQTFCSDSTFVDASDSLTPANWRDCAALFSAWADENGTFVINTTTEPVAILRSGSCTLAVTGEEGPYTVSDDDLEKILDYALKEYSHGTLLAVMGNVDCQTAQGNGTKGALEWRISNTDG